MAPSPKVVLYNPSAVFYTMPLSLVAIGSHLDRGRYEVVLVDARLEADPHKALASHLDGAVCLGVSVLTGAPIEDAIRASRVAKRVRPDLPVVWGGWHPSMFGVECLEEPSVDVTVQGQGEETFAEIVARLADDQPLDGCLGCTFRIPEGEVRVNPPRPFVDINRFASHDYGLIDVGRYFRLKDERQLDFIASQGCRFRCAFCADPFVFDRNWVGLDPERIGREVQALHDEHGFSDLSFQDETFFTSAKRVAAIAEEFQRRRLPITWAATMRADQCRRLSEEVFAKCRDSGFRRALIGVESGSPRTLARIRKDIDLEEVFFAAERCAKYGVGAIFPFIVGFPDEEDESVQSSLNVAKRLRSMSADFQTPIFYFKPYPGTALTQEAVANGYEMPETLEDWARFDFIGSAGPWVSEERFRRVERFKFYQQVAWDDGPLWRRPLQRAARWRLQNDVYRFPIEKALGQWLRPPTPLS